MYVFLVDFSSVCPTLSAAHSIQTTYLICHAFFVSFSCISCSLSCLSCARCYVFLHRAHSGTGGLLFLRFVENSRGRHDGREVDSECYPFSWGAQYYESVGLLPDWAGGGYSIGTFWTSREGRRLTHGGYTCRPLNFTIVDLLRECSAKSSYHTHPEAECI